MLTVNILDGNVPDLIVSDPEGIQCGTDPETGNTLFDCSEKYPANTNVKLYRKSFVISSQIQWSGDCDKSMAPVIYCRMDSDKNVYVKFSETF